VEGEALVKVECGDVIAGVRVGEMSHPQNMFRILSVATTKSYLKISVKTRSCECAAFHKYRT